MADDQVGQLPGLTPQEQELLKKMFSSPLDIPAEFRAWLVSYLEANPPEIPFTQLFGYQNFVSTQVAAFADSGQSVSMPANTFNSAAGPQLLNLPAGKYIIIAGIEVNQLNGPQLTFQTGTSFTVNGGAQGDFTKAEAVTISTPFSITTTISGSGQGAGGSINNSWLIAIRYDNP